MLCVLGIDGGGTKTVCLLSDTVGNIKGRGKGGGSNIFLTDAGRVKASLRHAILSSLENSDLSDVLICEICAGVAGAREGRAKEQLTDILIDVCRAIETEQPLLPRAKVSFPADLAAHIQVCGDIEITLRAGEVGDFGVVVLVGTGSVVFGINAAGESARVGGWGPTLSPQGSGYDIGCRALRAIACAHDLRTPPTMMHDLVLDFFGVSTLMDLVAFLAQGSGQVSEVARLTKVVREAAALGDEAAREILSQAARQLGSMSATVIRRLGLQGQTFPVILSGGVFEIEAVTQTVSQEIQALSPGADVQKLPCEPAYGAVTMALEKARISGTPRD